MNRKRNKIGVFCLMLSVLMAFQAEPTTQSDTLPDMVNTDICGIENRTFQNGEEITYKLYYNWNFIWLPAGEVVFKVKDLGSQYYVSAIGKTYPSYEWFYKVKDIYETYLDKETLLPLTSIRDVHEGKYRLYDKVEFDQQKGKATSLRGNTKDKATVKQYDIDNCMHDILSIVYFSRNVDFENFQSGQEFPIKIFMDKESWPLKVKFEGKDENKKIKGSGKYKTIKFSPEIIAGGIFKEKTELSVWVSDDKNRIPLLIESALSIGHVKAVLKNYKGLKYDMNARIN